MNVMRIFCATLLLFVITAGPTRASVADPVTQEDKIFLEALKYAIASDDAAWVAAQIVFPLRVMIAGRLRWIRDQKDFISHYPEIINEKVRAAVEDQDPETLFKDWHGLMAGNGNVWFGRFSDDDGKTFRYYIFGINN